MKRYKLFLLLAILLPITSCSDFLDREPDQLLSDEAVFNDPKMIKSALANIYGRARWGQKLEDSKSFIYLDEACLSNGGPDQTNEFANDLWRIYPYTLIRNINQLLRSIRNSDLETSEKVQLEGEVRFLRAWTYFNMIRGLGGIPLVGDQIMEYTPGMDIETLRLPRSTEEESYNYVINECTAIVDNNMLPEAPSINAARATKWAALALKARAAIYAASIAKYNNLMEAPIRTDKNEIGIDANKAKGYYETALKACREVIKGGKYQLQETEADKGVNFYNAVTIKENNVEVIWAVDYKYPGLTHQFTTSNIMISAKEDQGGSVMTPILNLVEAFEYVNDRDGSIKTHANDGDYIYYDKAEDAFAQKDARLYGTVIYPGAKFKGKEVIFQAGRKYLENGAWKTETSTCGTTDETGNTITALNGPVENSDNNINKSGFNIRKFLDETASAGTISRGSEVWYVQFRYAEILLTAAEAAMELNDPSALGYINQVRSRAGIQPLESVTLNDIIRERRVEFAFENQRYWDLKRWRIAHKLWDGDENNSDAVQYVLFPYVIHQPGDPRDGKWVFEKKKAYMAPYPRNFQLRNYYNFIDQGWINNNPNLTKNPYQ